MNQALSPDAHIRRRDRLHYLRHLARRNPLFIAWLAVLACLVAAALFVPWITPYPQDAAFGINFADKLQPRRLRHLFGADALGRDIFTRVIFGARMSLKIGLTVISLSLAVGVPMGPLVIQASMDMGYAILAAASLSFIGVGAKPPTVEWGLMTTSSRAYFLDYWWTVTFPGLAIFVSVLAFNLVGDGLRDILDPRIRD